MTPSREVRLDTFTDARELVSHPEYDEQRRAVLAAIDWDDLDAPVVPIARAFESLSHCFTLQCCHGHFVTAPGQDEHSLAPVPADHEGPVRYRIAYVAFCVRNDPMGQALLDKFSRLPSQVDPERVQFGSAGWFWAQWVNSYVLQVEPFEQRFSDQAALDADEARHVERVRDRFFEELRRVLAEEQGRSL